MIHKIYHIYKIIKKKVRDAYCWRYNRFFFRMNGVSFGRDFMVSGFPILKIASTARVKFGDQCVLTSGSVNPLCSNKRMVICCRPDSELIIGDYCGFSSTIFDIRQSVRIGNYLVCGANVIFMDSDAHSLNYLERRNAARDDQNKVNKGIVVGDDVLIGMNSVILKGVHIGDRAIIAANSLVTKDVPSDCIVGGQPARIIRRMVRSNEE